MDEMGRTTESKGGGSLVDLNTKARKSCLMT